MLDCTLPLLRQTLFCAIFAFAAWNGEKISKTDAEWEAILGQARYNVMRKKGMERSHLGEYVSTEKNGIYHCAACDLPLFDSLDKYNSGSGYPSFTKPIASKNVYYLEDWRMPFKRYEVICSRCDSHLGHVFNNGTKKNESSEKRQLRYCINSIALTLKGR